MSREKLAENIQNLYDVVARLRHPTEGCPWDLEQTHKSLLKYLIEESYEFSHSVEEENFTEMCDELGDVLLQVVLHARLAEEKNKFHLNDVIKVITEKMIRRHPHVFSDENDKSIEGIKKNWEKIKAKEKAQKEISHYEIDKDLFSFPALTSSSKIGKKTSKINFDWDNYKQVVDKVEEEWAELKEELAPEEKMNKERVYEELGDTLFSMAQLARHLGIDPEVCLRDANLKFKRRFNQVEDIAKERNMIIKETSKDKLESLWKEVKSIERENSL